MINDIILINLNCHYNLTNKQHSSCKMLIFVLLAIVLTKISVIFNLFLFFLNTLHTHGSNVMTMLTQCQHYS